MNSYPGLKPGDEVKLKMNGKDDLWKVAGIFQFVNQEGVIAYANYEYLSKYQHFPNKSFSYRIVTDKHEPAYQQAMADKLDQNFRDKGFKVNNTQTGPSTLKKASESLGILVTFLLIMALLTAVVGSIGLTGTMSMNVLERTREIGIMRSIGAVDQVIMRTVITEGVVIGMISWGIGAILSIPFSYLLSSSLSNAIFNLPIPVKFTLPKGYLIWLLVVLSLAALASILPARKASPIDHSGGACIRINSQNNKGWFFKTSLYILLVLQAAVATVFISFSSASATRIPSSRLTFVRM